jgi:hypothetical protein
MFPPSFDVPDGSTTDLRTPRLCATILDAITEATIEFRHASGDFWFLATELLGQQNAARAEFTIGSEGTAEKVGVEFEPALAAKGVKIWLQKEI